MGVIRNLNFNPVIPTARDDQSPGRTLPLTEQGLMERRWMGKLERYRWVSLAVG